MNDQTALAAEFAELENAWWRALRDRDWVGARSFMRDDFSITTAGWIDAPLGADAWLESLAGRYQLDFFDYDEITVRTYGDVAVVQSRSHQRGTLADTGEGWSGTFRYTDVWVRDGDRRWQIAVRHADRSFGPSRDGRATFQRLDRNPRWAGLPDLDEAGMAAVEAYFRAYGPATPDHVRYWVGDGLGAARKRVRSAPPVVCPDRVRSCVAFSVTYGNYLVIPIRAT
jgi:ketosteroid isomerase-like protein